MQKSNSALLFGGLALVLIVAGFFVFKSRTQNGSPPTANVERKNTQAESTPTLIPTGPVKEFTVDGTNFAFDPKTITVKKGDTVKITFKDDDGRHNLVVDGYDVSTETIGPGNTSSVTFVAEKSGSFEYFCSVANHRDLGMTGTLTVQ